jgi:oligopeptide/dipeptide ABC transporter ATP-binding protein
LALLSAVPEPDPDRADEQRHVILAGDVPSPINPPAGCRFHPRCPKAEDRCRLEEPALEGKAGDAGSHQVACHFPVADGEELPTVTVGRPPWAGDEELP